MPGACCFFSSRGLFCRGAGGAVIKEDGKIQYFRYLLVLAASGLIIVSRKPDTVLNPQFWAEDGTVWYADAYNHGPIYSLFTPEAGYFQTFSRLVGIFSQMFPLEYGPIIFNLTAILVQSTVACFILSSRLSGSIPSIYFRLSIAFLYLALPHSYEVHANVTNAQWHLGLLCFLIIAAGPSRKIFWRVFDFCVVFVSALSGPLCLLLIPVAGIKFLQTREKGLVPVSALLVSGAAVQGIALLTHARPTSADLGAGIGLFIQITFRHIFVGPIIGQGGFHLLTEYLGWNAVLIGVVCLFGTALMSYALLKATLELRLFILFSVLIYAAALISPAVTPTDGQWSAIAAHNTSVRYWFIPGICVLVTLLFLAWNSASRFIRYASIAILVFLPYGIVKDWSDPKFQDLSFSRYAKEFEIAAPGTEVTIPVNPDWEMKLIKKH